MMKQTEAKIERYNISIVCQGVVIPKLTAGCIRSLRTSFPGAELVLSTWEGTDISGLDVDKIVFSPDPGAFVADEFTGILNNVNRQLVSTKAGLGIASRPFILKTRTDIIFESADFITFFGRYDNVPSPILKNRLLICNYYTRNPRVMPLCFTPSDWIAFGRAEDVRKYYEGIPQMTEEDAHWFKEKKKASTFYTNYMSRFTPEQHFFLGFLRQYYKVNCDCYYDCAPELVEQTERTFAECFVILDYGKQLNIVFPKYDPNRYMEKYTLIGHWQWRAIYEYYCGKKRSARWIAYRFCGSALRLVSFLRTGGVLLLDRIGLKEKVKGLLNKRKY